MSFTPIQIEKRVLAEFQGIGEDPRGKTCWKAATWSTSDGTPSPVETMAASELAPGVARSYHSFVAPVFAARYFIQVYEPEVVFRHLRVSGAWRMGADGSAHDEVLPDDGVQPTGRVPCVGRVTVPESESDGSPG